MPTLWELPQHGPDRAARHGLDGEGGVEHLDQLAVRLVLLEHHGQVEPRHAGRRFALGGIGDIQVYFITNDCGLTPCVHRSKARSK